MAVDRVLTSDEREILQVYTRFISNCNWALNNFAVTWTDDSQTTALVASVGYNKWAVNRFYSANLLFQLGSDPTIGKSFVILLKNTNLWDSSIPVFNPETVINYMLNHSPNLFDSQMQAYINEKTQTYIF